MARRTKQYQELEHKVFLWDAMPFYHINFTGRVIEKYGKDYFQKRYDLIAGKFYDYIHREKLDNIDKALNLSSLKEEAQGENFNNVAKSVPVMNIPEQYNEIWKNTIPSKYFNDFKNRKYFLDGYLRSLTPEQQAEAIKTMCLNNESKNYLAFLDISEDQMTDEQRVLFKKILAYVENQNFLELNQKDLLIKRLHDSSIEFEKLLREKNDVINKQVSDFLYQHDKANEDLDYIKLIEKEKENDISFFDNNESDIDFKYRADNIDSANIRDQFKIRNTDAKQNAINAARAYESLLENSGLLKSTKTPYSTTLNSEIIRGINNYSNNQVKIQENWRANNINKQNVNIIDVDYKDYVKIPNSFNIADLIYNRELQSNHNQELVNQIVNSSIYINNEYIKSQSGKTLLNEPVNKLGIRLPTNNNVKNYQAVSKARDPFNYKAPINKDEQVNTYTSNNSPFNLPQVAKTLNSIQLNTITNTRSNVNNSTEYFRNYKQKSNLQKEMKPVPTLKPISSFSRIINNQQASNAYTNNKKIVEPQQKTIVPNTNKKSSTKMKEVQKEGLTKEQIKAKEALKKQAIVLKAIPLTK